MPPEKYGSRSCGKVVCCISLRNDLGLMLRGPPAAWMVSAATAAACGAAALVPKKFGKVSSSCKASLLKKVVFAPSIAARSGFWRTSGFFSGLLFLSKYIVHGPGEVNDSGVERAEKTDSAP